MKKITPFILALALLSVLCLGLVSCSGVEVYEDYLCRFNAESNSYTITGYRGSATELNIPASLNGKPVTAIAKDAFRGYVKITKVVLPDTVTSIGQSSFLGCTALTSFEANKITVIPDAAFSGCTALTDVKLPEGLTEIGYRAFSGCKALAAVELPKTVEKIYHYAFADCTALTSFGVKSDLSVYANAFAGCTSLKTISTPATPTNAVYKFSNGVMFSADGKTIVSFILDSESYEIPANVTSISGGAFFGTLTLTELTVATGNTYFKAENGVLYTADGTTLVAYPAGKSGDSFELPKTVTKLADCAFSGNPLLKSITLNDTVTSIGKSAFENCTALTELNVGNATATVGEKAFAGCINLESYIVADKAPAYKFVGGVLFTADETGLVSYPAGKTETAYIIPASVKTVAPGAFALGASLTEIKLAEGNTNFKVVDGVLYTADGATLVAFPCKNAKAELFEIPENVTAIAEGAFRNSSIKTIVIPKAVLEIKADTFRDCSDLSIVDMNGAVNKIGNNAFSGCDSLLKIFYSGTEAQWASAKASGTGNDVLNGVEFSNAN